MKWTVTVSDMFISHPPLGRCTFKSLRDTIPLDQLISPSQGMEDMEVGPYGPFVSAILYFLTMDRSAQNANQLALC